MKTLMVLAVAVVLLFPVRILAHSAKPVEELVVLGSGGPRAFGRAGSSYIVVVEGRPRILVDAGPGAFLRIGKLNVDLENVDTVLLTHLHIDHSGDLAAFFNARALTADAPIVDRIFGPVGAGRILRTRGGRYMKDLETSQSLSIRGVAIIATAIGAVAVGAFAIGALAIGRLAIRRVVIETANLKSLEIQDLTVTRLQATEVSVSDSLKLPGSKVGI
jgi:ribonuclease BN (tRNA processing enzyme)